MLWHPMHMATFDVMPFGVSSARAGLDATPASITRPNSRPRGVKGRRDRPGNSTDGVFMGMQVRDLLTQGKTRTTNPLLGGVLYSNTVTTRLRLRMKFQGTDQYVATDDLKLAVNAALKLQRPLLVKGEPGTGKTMLAEQVSEALGMPLLQWHIKSTTKAQQGLYEYDAVSRLRDSQLGDEKVKDIHNYIVKGVLWQAFDADQPVALLIDEIDKADIEFPNDLLRELDRMEFYVYETRQLVKARHRPLVIITSNNEKDLPDAFLRRCFFHYIRFPDATTMKQIVDVHFPHIKKDLLSAALRHFCEVRNLPGLKKKPSTSELIDWLKLLVAEDIQAEALQSQDNKVAVPPLVGALLKNEQDLSLFEKLVYMARHHQMGR